MKAEGERRGARREQAVAPTPEPETEPSPDPLTLNWGKTTPARRDLPLEWDAHPWKITKPRFKGADYVLFKYSQGQKGEWGRYRSLAAAKKEAQRVGRQQVRQDAEQAEYREEERIQRNIARAKKELEPEQAEYREMKAAEPPPSQAKVDAVLDEQMASPAAQARPLKPDAERLLAERKVKEAAAKELEGVIARERADASLGRAEGSTQPISEPVDPSPPEPSAPTPKWEFHDRPLHTKKHTFAPNDGMRYDIDEAGKRFEAVLWVNADRDDGAMAEAYFPPGGFYDSFDAAREATEKHYREWAASGEPPPPVQQFASSGPFGGGRKLSLEEMAQADVQAEAARAVEEKRATRREKLRAKRERERPQKLADAWSDPMGNQTKKDFDRNLANLRSIDEADFPPGEKARIVARWESAAGAFEPKPAPTVRDTMWEQTDEGVREVDPKKYEREADERIAELSKDPHPDYVAPGETPPDRTEEERREAIDAWERRQSPTPATERKAIVKAPATEPDDKPKPKRRKAKAKAESKPKAKRRTARAAPEPVQARLMMPSEEAAEVVAVGVAVVEPVAVVGAETLVAMAEPVAAVLKPPPKPKKPKRESFRDRTIRLAAERAGGRKRKKRAPKHPFLSRSERA